MKSESCSGSVMKTFWNSFLIMDLMKGVTERCLKNVVKLLNSNIFHMELFSSKFEEPVTVH